MKQQKHRVQTREHEIFIIARVTKNRRIIPRISRQVFELTAAFNAKLNWIGSIVQFRSAAEISGVNAIEIEEWRADIR